MKNVLIIATISALLSACDTPYQGVGRTGGYSETQLDKNMFSVVFKGNGCTRREKVNDYALLRSAEVTLDNNFNYFVIVNSDNYSTSELHTTPGYVQPVGNGFGIVIGGGSDTVTKFSTTNTIICFIEKPVDQFSYNAKFVYDSIALKYDIIK